MVGGAFRTEPDITLARKALDWEPHVKLADGLRKTIGYFEQCLREDAE